MALETPDIQPIANMVTTHIVHGTEGENMVSLIDRTADPDCDFDKSFGFPCSDREMERIKKANEEHRKVHEY